MSTAARVDVVMADAVPAIAPVAQQSARPRVIVIAPTKELGLAKAAEEDVDTVAIVTPRAPEAARGHTAEAILEAPGLTDEQRQALIDEATPALTTAQPTE